MGKIADKYFKVHPWMIIEKGFDSEHAMTAESIFSQANEYMGVRGYLEEGCSCPHLRGSYFNGIYERMHVDGPHYKGIVNSTEFMVNSADWLHTRIFVDGVKLDLANARIREFSRTLDMRNGLLTREFIWELTPEKEIRFIFERILSMAQVENAAQRITVQSLNFSGEVQIEAGIDFSIFHHSVGRGMWKNICSEFGEDILSISGETLQTGQKLCCKERIYTEGLLAAGCRQEEKRGRFIYKGTLEPGKEAVLERTVRNLVCKNPEEETLFKQKCGSAGEILRKVSFGKILQENSCWWRKVWEKSDIVIEGDPENQQGIRFCIFQMFQTYHGAVPGSNIGAKGLTGEAYNGNAFWDTETYCLPFFLFQDPEGARNLLRFRYDTLEEAKKRAAELDCKGAFYPIATISGRECCSLWQHASLQLQASTAVAYGIWFYEKVTRDLDFLKEYGMEMLIEISRMLATRGDYFEDGKKYGYFGVMGPDEFQMMVNNNCYTNAMGKFTLHYTLEMLKKLKKTAPEAYNRIVEKCSLSEQEPEQWKQIAEKMYIPYHPDTEIYEQHEGYFELPHVEVDGIPVKDFPLYEHWTYDRIYRNDMIKQPDVLMLMLLFNQSFSQECLKKNYEFYEPRCIHESSLSPSVHSILAAQLGKKKEASDFFGFATRMDLDNYNRNSGEGIHTTSIAAAWMNIVYGFGGFRSDGKQYVLNPSIPQGWEKYSFHLLLDQRVVYIGVTSDYVEIHAQEPAAERDDAEEKAILIYGKPVIPGTEPCVIPIPKEEVKSYAVADS